MLTRISPAAVGLASLLALSSAPAVALTSTFAAPAAPQLFRSVWWDGSGHWRADEANVGFRPAQPHYHCWRPLHGPLRCQWDY